MSGVAGANIDNAAAYNRQCLDLWGKKYGEQVAAKVERLVKDKWHESPSSSKPLDFCPEVINSDCLL